MENSRRRQVQGQLLKESMKEQRDAGRASKSWSKQKSVGEEGRTMKE